MPKMTIDLSVKVDAILRKLAKADSSTKHEVLRRALAIYNFLHEEDVRVGGTRNLAVIDNEDKIVVRIVFIQ